ncbi:MAG TPA: glycosyltransferase [Rhizomicrobium sp.]|nr:glycosyltransferase [Rhizomicrobium sp.]
MIPLLSRRRHLVKSRVPVAVSGQPDVADVAEAANQPGWSSLVDERLNASVSMELPEVPQIAPAGILHRNRSCEISVAFDPDSRDAEDFSFVIDDSKVVPVGSGGSAPAVRFVNMIANSDFAADEVSPWLVAREGGLSQRLTVNFDEHVRLEGAGTAYAWIKSPEREIRIDHVGEEEHPDPIEVAAGEEYCFAGYFATHRCTGRLVLAFHDRQGRLLQEREEAIPPEIPGGTKIADYTRVSLRARAPEGANAATLALGAERLPAAADGCLFVTRLWFGRCASAATPDWEPAPAQALKFPSRRASSRAHLVLPLPLACSDGGVHSLRIVDRATGFDVEGSPIEFRAPVVITGEIADISGDRVDAAISLAVELDENPSLVLRIDGEHAAEEKLSGAGRQRRIEFAIPPRWCDGRPHLFTLAVAETGQVLAHHPAVSPTMLTPLDALQTYAGLPFDASFSPAARARYRALLDQLGAPGGARADLRSLHDSLLQGPVHRDCYKPLTFPRVEHPRVSIVIPVHDKFEMTYFCLSALLFAWNRASFEVIVVDDGSTDETLEIQNIVHGIKHARHVEAKGFVRACNRGAQAAEGDYIVFLNNDTEPTSRWLDELLYAFESFDGVGLAGAKLLYPNGVLQEAGGIVWANGNPWNYGRNQNAAAPEYSYTRQVDYVSGAALMIPRQVWRDVGGFSEEFAPAYFEDTDLAFKVRARGLKTVYVPHAVVYHYEGASSGTSVASGAKRFQEVNRPKFKRKWSSAFAGNGQEGVNVEHERDRGPRYRALMLDFEVPRIGFDAGSYAGVQEIRALQALGFKVTFLPTNCTYLGRHTEALQRIGVETSYAPFVRSIEAFLAAHGREFHLVYVTRHQVAAQTLAAIRKYAPQAKVILNLADLHFLRELRAGVATQDASRIDAAVGIREAELAVLRAVDLTLSYSAVEEAVILSHNLNSTKTGRLPWVAEPIAEPPDFAERMNIGFLGGFRHTPNAEAVDFFLDRVMPGLIRELPEVQFEIYGSAISRENRKRWNRENTVVKGQVDRVEEMLGHIRVFVAPLASGAGVKGKVFDALAHGVPSVLSPLAAEGIGVRNGTEVLIAWAPEEWVKQIVRLYTDGTLWTRLSAAGRQLIETEYSFAHGVETMRVALDKAGFYCEPDPSYLVLNRCLP